MIHFFMYRVTPRIPIDSAIGTATVGNSGAGIPCVGVGSGVGSGVGVGVGVGVGLGV